MAQVELTLLWGQVESSLEVDRDEDLEGTTASLANTSPFKQTTRTRHNVHCADVKGLRQAKPHLLNELISFDFPIVTLDEHGTPVFKVWHFVICTIVLRRGQLDYFVTIAKSQAKVVQICIVGVYGLKMRHLGLKLLWHCLLNLILKRSVSDKFESCWRNGAAERALNPRLENLSHAVETERVSAG